MKQEANLQKDPLIQSESHFAFRYRKAACTCSLVICTVASPASNLLSMYRENAHQKIVFRSMSRPPGQSLRLAHPWPVSSPMASYIGLSSQEHTGRTRSVLVLLLSNPSSTKRTFFCPCTMQHQCNIAGTLPLVVKYPASCIFFFCAWEHGSPCASDLLGTKQLPESAANPYSSVRAEPTTLLLSAPHLCTIAETRTP